MVCEPILVPANGPSPPPFYPLRPIGGSTHCSEFFDRWFLLPIHQITIFNCHIVTLKKQLENNLESLCSECVINALYQKRSGGYSDSESDTTQNMIEGPRLSPRFDHPSQSEPNKVQDESQEKSWYFESNFFFPGNSDLKTC